MSVNFILLEAYCGAVVKQHVQAYVAELGFVPMVSVGHLQRNRFYRGEAVIS